MSANTQTQHRAYWLIASFALVHLVMGAIVPLSADEAHYALYGYFADISYFDHPPMVGWLQAMALLVSEDEWALRVFPIAIHAAASVVLLTLSNRWFAKSGKHIGLLAVCLYYTTIIGQLMGMGLVPDGPLILFALLIADVVDRLLEDDSIRNWLLLGLLLGLAGLSKYTAVTLAFSVILCFVILDDWKRLFSTKAIAMGALALGIVSPVLIWNYQHDWLSFAYQIDHGTGDGAWRLDKALKMQAAQFGSYGPFIYLLGAAAMIWSVRQNHTRSKLLLIFALPILALFAYAAGKGRSLPHWTVVGVVLVCPIIAHFLLQHWKKRLIRVLTYFTLGYGVIVVGFIHLVLSFPIPFPDYKSPARDFVGWQQAAEKAVALKSSASNEQVIFIHNWSYASRIAWYARPEKIIVLDKRYDQFDLWYGSPSAGMSGILVFSTKGKDKTPKQINDFERCEKVDSYTAHRGGNPVEHFDFYQCDNLVQLNRYKQNH